MLCAFGRFSARVGPRRNRDRGRQVPTLFEQMTSRLLFLALSVLLAACTLESAQLGSAADAVDGGTIGAGASCGDAGTHGTMHGGMGGMHCATGAGGTGG